MSTPTIKVELGVSIVNIGAGIIPFTLNSTTYGVLGDDKLSSLQFFDVSSFVKSVSVERGRSTQLDNYRSGSATVVFYNKSRDFDPFNTSSLFYPDINPRNLIRITADGEPVFYGFVKDWDINYLIDENHMAVAYCSDAFAILANLFLSAVTPSAQKTGARINYVLDRSEINYIGPRAIDTGLTDLGAYNIAAQTNCLTYLRQVERSEQGNFFVSAAGVATFKQRQFVSADVVLFADDGTGINYRSLKNVFGDELLYNRVVVSNVAGTKVTATDNTSIAKYQISELSWDDLLNSSSGELASLSEYVLDLYKQPKLRFSDIEIELAGLSEEDTAKVLALDLVDVIEITKSFVTGTPAKYSDFFFISGVKHQVSPGSHVVSFSLESSPLFTVLILGSQYFGLLDTGVLSFLY